MRHRVREREADHDSERDRAYSSSAQAEFVHLSSPWMSRMCMGGGTGSSSSIRGKETSNQDSGRGLYTDSDYLFTEVCELWCGAGGPPAGWRGPAGAAGSRDGGTGWNWREVVMQSF